MWLFQCNLEKLFVLTSFIVVFVICLILVTDEDSEGYSDWFMEKMSSFNMESWMMMENRTDADTLQSDIRILCMVMTHPGNHKTKAKKVGLPSSMGYREFLSYR